MTKFCPICGAKNETAAVRCTCGRVFEDDLKAALQSPSLADPRYYRKKQTIRKAGALLGIVTVVFLFTAYFAGAFPTPKQNKPEVNDEKSTGVPLRQASIEQTIVPKPIFPDANVSYKATRVVTGSILAVTDTLGQERRVTLLGIRVPKLDENFGAESKENLWRLVAERPLLIKPYKFSKEADTIAEVMVDGSNISLAHLRSGLALIVPEELAGLPAIEQQQYAAAVHIAKTAKYGIWSGVKASDPIPQVAGQDIPALPPAGLLRGFSSPRKRSIDPAPDAEVFKSRVEEVPRREEPGDQMENAPMAKSVRVTLDNNSDDDVVSPKIDRKFIRGPRGGCYFFSPKGTKSYVDRSKCE